MATVLLGWELGGGLGHVGKLMALAAALSRLGHTPVLALSDLESTRSVWGPSGFEVIGAPVFRSPADGRQRVIAKRTYADVLMDFGNFTVERLLKIGTAWNRVLSRVKPDLVICDFAPNLAMQTLRRIPTITVGVGYCVPPAGGPFPPLLFWDREPIGESSRRNEAILLDNINAAGSRLGLGHFEHAADLFSGDEVFVCCLAELDCYRHVRSQPAIGSITGSALSPLAPRGRGVFAYFAAGDELPDWLDFLAASRIPATVYVRGGRPTRVPPSITLLDRPADLAQALSDKALLVHHGGMGTTETALRLGIPQLIMPSHFEQRITARLVASYGVGDTITTNEAHNPVAIGNLIARMAGDEALRLTTAAMAEAIAERQIRPALDIVVEAAGKYV